MRTRSKYIRENVSKKILVREFIANKIYSYFI